MYLFFKKNLKFQKEINDSLEIFEFGINYLNTIDKLNFETFTLLTNFTDKIEFWVICLKYLLEKNEEKLKNMSNIKFFFSKKLLKNSILWYTNYLDDFFEYKLMKSMNPNGKLSGNPLFLTINLDLLFKKIEIIANFFCSYPNLIPITIDFREVFFFDFCFL